MRAKELSAPYYDTAEVTIHLFKGDHYIVENRYDAMNIYYKKEAVDEYVLNIKMEIKSLTCDHLSQQGLQVDRSKCVDEAGPVVLHNKIKERFQIHVYTELTMNNFIIDSLDSILPPGTPCLSQMEQCCEWDPASGLPQNADLSKTDFNCTKEYKKLDLSDTCQRGSPQTLFKFIVNDDHTDYLDFKINQLHLSNSTIQHFFYPMNSLLNITNFGGEVKISNSKFTRINICGSIIKNQIITNPISNLSSISATYLTPEQKELSSLVSLASLEIDTEHKKKYYNTYDDTYSFPKNKIEIKGSTFEHLNFHAPSLNDTLPFISESSNMRY